MKEVLPDGWMAPPQPLVLITTHKPSSRRVRHPHFQSLAVAATRSRSLRPVLVGPGKMVMVIVATLSANESCPVSGATHGLRASHPTPNPNALDHRSILLQRG